MFTKVYSLSLWVCSVHQKLQNRIKLNDQSSFGEMRKTRTLFWITKTTSETQRFMARRYSIGLFIRKCNEFTWFRRGTDGSPRPESDVPFMPYNTRNFFPKWEMLTNKEKFFHVASSHLLKKLIDIFFFLYIFVAYLATLFNQVTFILD